MTINKDCNPRPATHLILVLLAGQLFLGSCGWFGHESRNWREDVMLDDGSTIRIRRHVKFIENSALAGDAYSATDEESTLQFPDDLGIPVWSSPLLPLVLYKDGDQWVIVSSTFSCEIWNEWDRPRPPYWEHRLIGSEWKRVALSDSSIGRSSNLFFSYGNEPPAIVSVKAKQERLRTGGIGEVYLAVGNTPRWSCS